VKPITSRLLPGFAILVAAILLLQTAGSRHALAALLPALPWTVLGGGILLGWVFHRSRVVLALTALALAHWAMVSFVGPTGSGRAVLAAVAILLPIDLAVMRLLPDRDPWSRRGRWDLALLLGQVLLVAWISRPAIAPLAALVQYPLMGVPLASLTALPHLALLAFAGALAALVVGLLKQPGAVEAGLLWALVAAFLALRSGRPGVESAVYLTAAALTLVVAVVEASRQLAYGDDLTGLPARRALEETMAGLSGHYAIAMVDVDHFKKFNDRHGHTVGDQLLRKVGAALGEVGGGGEAFRYGGEEFAVVFEGKSVEDVLPHLEAMRKAVECAGFVVRRPPSRQNAASPREPLDGTGRVTVTVSVGVAEAGRRHPTPGDVIKAADAALYRAKRAGRNRVFIADPAGATTP
jgi:diguanylate cyclase (GGDEF)-like protein